MAIATLKDIWRSRALVTRLAVAQLRNNYSGTAMGAIWAILQPAMMMAVYWFVFVFGLKVTTPSGQAPFVAMLIVGLAAWFWFADALLGGANAVTSNAYLVKKIAFPLEILPLVPTVAALWVHLVLLALVITGLAIANEASGWRLLHLPIYVLALAALAVALSYWLAALNVFHRDVAQTTGLVTQIWFWLTPIVWSFDLFPPEVAAVLAWNPMTYVITGYRYALLANVAEAPSLAQAAVFWIVTALLLAGGLALFCRLRADFADIL